VVKVPDRSRAERIPAGPVAVPDQPGQRAVVYSAATARYGLVQ
jgi:hypothetical protein